MMERATPSQPSTGTQPGETSLVGISPGETSLHETSAMHTSHIVPTGASAFEVDGVPARKALLAHMRHELRTPLNAILGYSAMLMEDAEDLGQQHFLTGLQNIHGTGNHVLSLINDLLDASRVEDDAMP